MASLVTNAGFANATAAWDAYASKPRYLQFGTGSGQTASSNALAIAAQTRVLGTTSQVTTSVTDDTYQLTGTVTASAARAVTEVGAFDAAGTGDPATGGNMDIYGDFSVINLANGDSIAFTVQVQVS